MTNSSTDEPRRNYNRAIEVFLSFAGLPPWKCSYCNENVLMLGIRSRQGVIHHIDEDPTNDVRDNLTIMHSGCHVRHHRLGRIGNRLGATVDDKTRARISNSLKGRPAAHGYSTVVCQKMSESAYKKPRLTCECGLRAPAGSIHRHMSAKGHKLRSDDE